MYVGSGNVGWVCVVVGSFVVVNVVAVTRWLFAVWLVCVSPVDHT